MLNQRIRSAPVVVAAAGALALALASTAGPATASQANSAGQGSGANFEVHMKLSGAVKGSLSFKVIELDTPCTGGTGVGSAGSDGVPSPDGEHVKFDGVELSYAINNASYKGPGTYPTADFASSSAAISADKLSEADPFAPANNAKSSETMVWHKNGSGSFVFKDWENSSTNRSLSGKFTWTCKK